MLHPVLLSKSFADFIYLLCVLERTYGKGGGEVVKAALLCIFCRLRKSQLIASEASFSAFVYAFKTLYGIIKFFGVKASFNERDRIFKFHFFYKSFLLFNSFEIFLFGIDVRIVVKKSDAEIFRQIRKTIAAAGCTAGMKKQRRYCAVFRVFFNEFVKFFLKVPQNEPSLG